MKRFLIILFVSFSLTVVGQKEMTEGVITSKMTMSSTNPDVQSQFDMIGDIISTTFFKDDKTRTDVMNMMTGESSSIIDNKEKMMMMIVNNPMAGGKVYAENTFEPSEQDLEGVSLTKGDGTKTVLGYECTEYNVVVNKDGAEVKMDIYATEKINAVNQQTTKLGEEFKGFPMYMVMHMNQMGMDMTMTMEVTEVKEESVADDKFDMTPPDGYTKVDQIQGM